MLLDNKKNGRVGGKLRKHLKRDFKVSVLSGLFSIYGFETLKKELGQVDSICLLISQAQGLHDPDPQNIFPSLIGDLFELRFKNQLNQTQVAKECAQWLTEKAEIRAAGKPNALNPRGGVFLWHCVEGKLLMGFTPGWQNRSSEKKNILPPSCISNRKNYNFG